jgi:hypothetical protein
MRHVEQVNVKPGISQMRRDLGAHRPGAQNRRRSDFV